MKTITIKISDPADTSRELARFHKDIPARVKAAPEFAALQTSIAACVEDFSAKIKKVAGNGTTMHIRKEFLMPGLRVVIILDYPRRAGFFEKLLAIAREKTFLAKLTA